MGIVIICYPACDAIDLVNNIKFLIMSFFYMIKKSEQKLKMMQEQKEHLRWNKEHFFIIFKGLSVGKNYLRPESAPLIILLGLMS